LAAGSLNGLSTEKCKVLKNRNVILYPDLGAYEKWKLKASEMEPHFIQPIFVSNLLELLSDLNDRSIGLDLADFVLCNSNY